MEPDPSFDRYARLVCRSIGVSVALVSLVEADRQVFPGACGLPPEVDAERETPLSHSFCQYVVADRSPLVVSDARADERLRDNLAIADLGVVAYAGWPLTDHTGEIVGSLCAIDTEPREWSADELALLEDLAAACSTELAQRGLRAAEEDLSHRSRVLLALSESLSGTHTLEDVATAVEQTALEHLRCLHAGMWLRESTDLQERVVFVDSPVQDWRSAKLNAVLPLDASNPLGGAIVRATAQHFGSKEEQNATFPHLDTSAQVGDARSFVPLLAGQEAIGALALVWEGRHELSPEDRLTIEALTAYTTQAVQRVLLTQDRLDALLTLQRSMLPRLPAPEGLELAARYRPADSRDQVGGDWFDAVVMRAGATSLMIGDVVGHNIEAAAVMGQLRHMLRAIAWAVDDVPSANVARLDHAVDDLAVDGMASLVYARIQPPQPGGGQRTLVWTNAGHPPPLVVSATGEVRLLDEAPDLLLGVDPTIQRTDRTTSVPTGSLLLLYTDGLVERRGEAIGTGLARLRDAAARAHSLKPDEFLDAVLGDLAVGRLEDDIAMLAVRFQE